MVLLLWPFNCCSGPEENNTEIGDKCKITADDICDEKLEDGVEEGGSTEVEGFTRARSSSHISQSATFLEGSSRSTESSESLEIVQNPETDFQFGFGLAVQNEQKQYPTKTDFCKLNPFICGIHSLSHKQYGSTTTSTNSSMLLPLTPTFKDKASSGLITLKEHTVLSDWGDAYEDTLYLSSQFSLMPSAITDASFSDVSYLDDNPVASNYLKIPVPPGKVLALCLTRGEQRIRLLNLKISLEEVVETFLSPGGGKKLPISFTESQEWRPRVMGPHRMAMTIEENLGEHLDAETQGLTFSVGPLNSKLCYKMCVCDLGQLQKILALTNSNKFLEEALGSPFSSHLQVHDTSKHEADVST